MKHAQKWCDNYAYDMRHIAVGMIVVALLAVGGCSSQNDSAATSTSAPATSTPQQPSTTAAAVDDYETYKKLSTELGGDVIEKSDAATRAQLLCSGSAKSMLGGMKIDNFPTDLALIRAYCPDKESIYR